MMVSDSHNYTQLTRDNLVTEHYHNSAHQSLSFLPSLHPGMFVIKSPIQLLLLSQVITSTDTAPKIHVCREMTEDLNDRNCYSLCSVNLLVEEDSGCLLL